jgi:hypothetical protein
MTSAVLIPGAGGLGWYWHLVERDLQDRGYEAFAVDLTAGGQTGLPAYARWVVASHPGPDRPPAQQLNCSTPTLDCHHPRSPANAGSGRPLAAATTASAPEFDAWPARMVATIRRSDAAPVLADRPSSPPQPASQAVAVGGTGQTR